MSDQNYLADLLSLRTNDFASMRATFAGGKKLADDKRYCRVNFNREAKEES